MFKLWKLIKVCRVKGKEIYKKYDKVYEDISMIVLRMKHETGNNWKMTLSEHTIDIYEEVFEDDIL